jgi:hypothetical protein
VEPRHHGVEHEANVRLGGHLTRSLSAHGAPRDCGKLAEIASIPQG